MIGVLIGFINHLQAQKTYVGTIVDASTNEPLPFVNIAVKGTSKGTTTDMDGKFSLTYNFKSTDSLMVSYVGYQPLTVKAQNNLTIALQQAQLALKEFVVEYQGNPADKMIKRIIKAKEKNNPEQYDYYEYKLYNKLELDLNNITDEFKNRKILKKINFIFDNIDSTSAKKPFLPVLLIESYSNYYYRKFPKTEKEYVQASRVSGINNESLSQFTGGSFQTINFYNNYVDIFGKSFVSPIADFGPRSYKYYLTDSSKIEGRKSYKLEFYPKNKFNVVLKGEFWVDSATLAIQNITAMIGKEANINFVNEFKIYQNFTLVDGKYWMLQKEQSWVDFFVSNQTMGVYRKRTTTYKDIKVNQAQPDSVYDGFENIIVSEDANEKPDSFWVANRHEELTKQEQSIYHMVDTLKKVPIFRTFIDIVKMIGTGYYEAGYFELGPYFTFYSNNQVEGSRFKFGGRTSNKFSKWLEFSGHIAYGTKDQEFKYGLGTRVRIDKQPRKLLGINYSNDMVQFGLSENSFRVDNVMSSFLRRGLNNKLTRVEKYETYYEHDWSQGFMNTLTLNYRVMYPRGVLTYEITNKDGTVNTFNNIKAAEIQIYTKVAKGEVYVSGEMDRVSLGSKYPIVETKITFGVKGILESQYQYQKLAFVVRDKQPVGVLGNLYWRLDGGKIFGDLPYPLLEIHQGNQSYFYDYMSFNLMNYFEFISDEYFSISLYHHFEGFFFNKIPLLRRLKWREVATGRMVKGNLSDRHQRIMDFPVNSFTLEKPYIETTLGIENILKFIRVDAIWRLTHKNNPDISTFGIRLSAALNF